MDENLQDKLKSLLANRNLMLGADWAKKREQLDQQRKEGVFEIDHEVPGTVVENESGRFYLVRQEYPLETPHGIVELGAALDVIPEQLAFSACDAELETFDPNTAVFIDTETTGLAGGTGTTAFLIGVGYFSKDKFVLEQAFMRDFDEEEAMLRYLDTLFANAETVVTFNGKSFDVPLLRTRYITNRLPFRLDALAHFDLIHAARRIWKMRLKDCSLGNIERTVLGIKRHGDVPSAEIPQMWLDYLHTRDARQLKRVFYHHSMDILSLAALMALMSQSLESASNAGFEHAEDQLSLTRLHFRGKRFTEAVEHANRLLETETDEFIRRETLELLAVSCKRLQDWENMSAAWELMRREFPSYLLPKLELAKHHEHRTRNIAEALALCEEIQDRLNPDANAEEEDFDNLQAKALRRRLQRLQRKQAKASPLDPDSGDRTDFLDESEDPDESNAETQSDN